MGKGREPEKGRNLQKYWQGFEEINWDGPTCFDCGMKINKKNLKEHSDLYEIFPDGAIRHKNCNFN